MSRVSSRLLCLFALAVSVGLATGVSPYASSAPDGLERVAAAKDFGSRAEPHPIQDRAPAPDYAIPGIESERLATGLAGFLGSLGVCALGYGLALLIRWRNSDRPRSRNARAAA